MSLTIKQAAVPYIHYQRTRYLRDSYLFTTLTRLVNRSPLFRWLNPIRFTLFASALKSAYRQDIQFDYDSIKSYLPKDAKHILDIGAGMAGIDALLSQHYNHQVNIHLLDKHLTDHKIYYGFKPRASFYNSFEATKDFLVSNGTPAGQIHTYDADEKGTVFTDRKYDLVISLISWGFHYPISTYITEVVRQLSDHGILIIDIRTGTEGINELKQYFQQVEIIYETEYLYRVYARQ